MKIIEVLDSKKANGFKQPLSLTRYLAEGLPEGEGTDIDKKRKAPRWSK